jgi:SAM-dependent methyltransferase
LTPDATLAANLAPVTQVAACKICGAAAALHGVTDFNKSCEASKGVHFPLSGVPVWYHRCPNCQFLFSVQFDHWTPAMFRQYIYNESYALVDPDVGGARAERDSVPLIAFARQVNAGRILDYGGGEGGLARILTEHGFAATSWDPMHAEPAAPSETDFDLVTAYEVLEHTPTPARTCREALSFVRPGGLFLFSTLTLDALPPQSCDHWYIAPRNGHISIHSAASLRLLFAGLGWRVHTYGPHHHLAFAEPGGTAIPGSGRMPDSLISSVPRAGQSRSPG